LLRLGGQPASSRHARSSRLRSATMGRKKSKQGAHLKGASTSRFNGENKSSREWLDSEDDTKDADFVESDGAEDEPDDTSDDEMSIEIAQTLRARAGRTSAGKRLKTTHTPPPGPRLRQGDIYSSFFSRAAAGTPSPAAVASDAAAGATPTTRVPQGRVRQRSGPGSRAAVLKAPQRHQRSARAPGGGCYGDGGLSVAFVQ